MQLSTVQLTVIVSVLVFALGSIRRITQTRRKKKELPFPPGPTRIPLIGNAHSVDLKEPWKTYTNWHTKYGNIFYARLLDLEVVVLGSRSIAVDLLEKRSRIYSGRPYIATIEAFGGDWNFGAAQYGDHWRLCRRIFHQNFRFEAALCFRPMQIRRARQLVINILNDPNRYESHYSTFAAAVALSAAYGYEPKLEHDPIVQVIEDYSAASVPAATPEQATLLKLFPFLLYIPDWFPGSSLKLAARHAYALSVKVVEMPYKYAEQEMKTSYDHPSSMVSDYLIRTQKQDESQRAEHIFALKKVATSSVLASTETTMSSLMVFTLAMVLHPHVWKRAREGIDAVVGTSRLPDFDDRPALPYVEAIIRETVRWHPTLPLGVWHSTTGSDVYNGQYIPKDAMVVANVWAMSRDEIRFPDAEAFKPERFLNDNGTLNNNDPMDFVFGFGRRICPGRYAADASLWSAITTMLATLDFFSPRDEQGNELRFEPRWLNGLTHRPDVFPCQISPRAHVNKLYLERMLVA